MSGNTTNFAWQYPTGGDPANVAADELVFLAAIDASLGNAWSTYTPAWTSTGTAPAVNNGTIVGRYKLFGKWGVNQITLTAGGTTSYGTLLYRFSLPPAWTLLNTTSIYGVASIYDVSVTTAYSGVIWAASTTTVSIRTHAATTDASATVPIAVPASGDIWNMLMLVELA